jgi:hypothetical protein
MHTCCRLFVHIDSSCADFMHTDSVLCRLFADLVHTLRRVNVFHSNAAARPAGPGGGRLPNRGGGAMAAAPRSYAYLGEAAAAARGPALLGEAAVPPPPATLLGEGGALPRPPLRTVTKRRRRQQLPPSRAKRWRRLEAPPAAAKAPSSWRSGPSRRPWWLASCRLRYLRTAWLPERLKVVNVLLVLLLDERQKRLPDGGVDLVVVALNPKVWGLWREGGSKCTGHGTISL